MSHSTNVGFSGPPASAFNGNEFLSYCDAPPLLLASWVVGVGSILRGVDEFPYFTASVKLTPACALLPGKLREPALFASPAVGVGHSFTAVRSPPSLGRFFPFDVRPPSASATVGVGHRFFFAMVSRLGLPALGLSNAPPFPLIPFCELP